MYLVYMYLHALSSTANTQWMGTIRPDRARSDLCVLQAGLVFHLACSLSYEVDTAVSCDTTDEAQILQIYFTRTIRPWCVLLFDCHPQFVLTLPEY